MHEHSKKHGAKAYKRTGANDVSPMPLDDKKAQESLISLLADGKRRYSFYEGKYYCFHNTRLNIFHGFEISKADVP